MASGCRSTPETQREETPRQHSELLEEVVVIGASVSDGFMLRSEIGASVSLADVLAASIRNQPVEVAADSSAMLFRRPIEHGREMVDFAQQNGASLVVAVDFLFWFGYGHMFNESSRFELLETGLALLDEIQCPIVIGDLPDMTPATRGEGFFGGPMIRPSQVPRPATLEQLNRRLLAWAEERERIVVVPISYFLERTHGGGEIEIRGNLWSGDRLRALLQKDLLHPTLEGSVALAILIMDSLVNERPELSPQAVIWKADKIRKRILAATAEERRETEERKQRREARRLEREARAASRE